MRRSSVSWWLVLCFALLLLLAGFGALRALEPPEPSTQPSYSSDSPTLGGISETLSEKIAELKERLIERSREVEQLRLELQLLQTDLLETSSSLRRSQSFLTSMSHSFESYRRAAEARVAELQSEIRRQQVWHWIERGAWAAAVGMVIWVAFGS
jgi:TolA-binding protein